MKYLLFILSTTCIFLSSCSSVDCSDTATLASLGIEVETAYDVYLDDPSTDNCKELKSLIEETLEYSDCEGNTPEDIEFSNEILGTLDC